jgi:peptide deformylase
MILNILHDGDEILKRLSCPVILNDEVKEFIGSMKETMIDANGIGLAAPQVGRNIRVIVVKLQYGEIQEMINPTVKWYSDHTVNIEEGCLSIPGHYINITRPSKISLSFQDLSGKYKRWKLKSLEARIVQHEIDHLNGVLMTDYE